MNDSQILNNYARAIRRPVNGYPGLALQVVVAQTKKNEIATIAQRLGDAASAAREKALKSVEKQIAESEATLVKSQADLSLAEKEELAASNALKAANIRTGIADENEKAAKQKLENEFLAERADIDTYLTPFISSGRTYRGTSEGSGPVSYSVIVSSGGLVDSLQGLNSLGRLGNSASRPTGGFPNAAAVSTLTSSYSKGAAQFLERAQLLLNKYGKLMVEKELLAK